MDAYGRPTSVEIIEELTLVRTQRLNILKQKNASESSNSKQEVKISTAHLETLNKHEEMLRAQLAEALSREGNPAPGEIGIMQIYPVG